MRFQKSLALYNNYTSFSRLARVHPSLPKNRNNLLVSELSPSSLGQRHKSNKTKSSKSKGSKSAIDDLLDELSDDEDAPEEEEETKPVRDTPLSRLLKASTKGKSGKGVPASSIRYPMFVKIVDGEELWREMEDGLEGLKQFYLKQLSVRSAASLDSLLVELEGDKFPLNEIAGAGGFRVVLSCHHSAQPCLRRTPSGW